MEVKFTAENTVRIPKGCKAIVKDDVVIFEPKECNFKKGDVIVSLKGEILLVDEYTGDSLISYVNIDEEGTFFNTTYEKWIEAHDWELATDEEKQKLFAKMKEQGLRWNTEEKRVEKIRWRAEYRCRYHLITSCLKVGSNIDFRHTEDEERWEVGNYFQTGEEAEEAAKILRESICKFHTEKTQ